MEGFLLLNRQNTMVYFDGDRSILKSYFKEVSIETSQEQYKLLIELLNASKKELVISDYLKKVEEAQYVKRLIKVLYDTGSIFIYPQSQTLSPFFKRSWFRVLTQYNPVNENILKSCQLIEGAVVHITQEVEDAFPKLRGTLIENDVVVSKTIGATFDENDWIICLDHTIKHQNVIRLSLSKDQLIGINHSVNDEYFPPLGSGISKKSLLYRVSAYYTTLYIIKSIAKMSKSTFSLNDEGKFYEYDLHKEEFKQTVEHLSFPQPKRSSGLLDYIGNFESFIAHNPNLPLNVSGWKDDHYANLFQTGFSTYALTDQSTTFVYAGLDYIETAMNSIKEGLSYYLNKELEKDEWMVTTPDSYYVDKALFLLQYVDEPFTVYKVDNLADAHPLHTFLNGANMKFSFYLKKFSFSRSSIVYLYDHKENKLLSDQKRTINPEEKMIDLTLNYSLLKYNPDQTLSTIVKEVPYAEHVTLLDSVDGANVQIERLEEKSFIEHSLHLLKSENAYSIERAWKYEQQLNNSNLIVRKIEVGSYENAKV